MESPTEQFSIESPDQEKDPATSRFLDSLGFGESVLKELDESAQKEPTREVSITKDGPGPSVVLSSQLEDIALPDAKIFSDPSPARRGGLQDIRKKQPSAPAITAHVKALALPEDEISKERLVEKNQEVDIPEQSLEEKHFCEEEFPCKEEEKTSDSNREQNDADKVEVTDVANEEAENIDADSAQIDFLDQLDNESQIETEPVSISSTDHHSEKSEAENISEIVTEEKENQEEEKAQSSGPEEGIELETAEDVSPDKCPTDTVLSDDELAAIEEETNEIVVEDQAEEEITEPEAMVLSCPKCHQELTLQKEYLGIEGTCVWCEIPIVAAASGSDGNVRIFILQTEEAPEKEIKEETSPEQPVTNVTEEGKVEESLEIDLPVVAEESPPTAPPLEIVDNLSFDSPEGNKNNQDSADPPTENKEETKSKKLVSDVEITSTPLNPDHPENEKSGNSPFANLPTTGFADLPSEPSAIPKELEADAEVLDDKPLQEENALFDGPVDSASDPQDGSSKFREEENMVPLPPMEDPKASTFEQLGHEALFSEPLPDLPPVDDANSEQFPFPMKSENRKEPEQDTSEPETNSPFSNLDEKEEEVMAVVELPASLDDTPQEITGAAISDISAADPLSEAQGNSPFPNAEPVTPSAEEKPKEKGVLPDDIVSFLANQEAEKEETPEEFEPEALDADSEDNSTQEQEEETPDIEEAPSLSKREPKKEKRAKKKADSGKSLPGTKGPLPTLAPAPIKSSARSGSKLQRKTKVGLISIAGLVVGFGIASFFVPVQEYVEKARTFMTEAFNKQIGLESTSPPLRKVEVLKVEPRSEK